MNDSIIQLKKKITAAASAFTSVFGKKKEIQEQGPVSIYRLLTWISTSIMFTFSWMLKTQIFLTVQRVGPTERKNGESSKCFPWCWHYWVCHCNHPNGNTILLLICSQRSLRLLFDDIFTWLLSLLLGHGNKRVFEVTCIFKKRKRASSEAYC